MFAALNIATGEVIADLRSTHTSKDFVRFLNKINRNVPDDLDVHIVLGNLSAHNTNNRTTAQGTTSPTKTVDPG